MSIDAVGQDGGTVLDEFAEFLRNYYRDEIGSIAGGRDDKSLWIDHSDLFSYSQDLAIRFKDDPDTYLQYLEEAIGQVDIPLPFDHSDVTVRVYGLTDEDTYAPGELRSQHAERYVGVHGILERVTTTSDLPEELVFICQRCGTETKVPQDPTRGEMAEPHECVGCDRKGPFRIDHRQSTMSDYAKVRIENRPDENEGAEGKIAGYVLNDLIDAGGNGLISRAGEPVTVYGVVRRVQKTGHGENELLFDHFLEIKAIEFDRDEETVDIEEHRETFEALAERDDAVDLWRDSVSRGLHGTDAWEAAFEFAVAYLFGAPRIDIENGPSYRGDMHFLIIGDFGTGKSQFKKILEMYSPKCISKSTTGLSSGVGLTAAAVKDDFGEGQWTLKPGLLVRANGGHLILDEIDKGPDELTSMNDALEGEQVVDIEKAGQSATYRSRTALMAIANPEEGRFDPYEPLADQIGIDESLLSRFDGIVTLQDRAEVDQDRKIADTWGTAFIEAMEAQYGEREDFDELDSPIPSDVGQAWIQHAREDVNPILREEQFKTLKDWYAEEVRQLNQDFAADGSEGENMPVPATVRVLATAAKMSIAFARVHLRDEVASEDVERAKQLGKKLVKQNWDGESFDVTKNMTKSPPAQKDRLDRLAKIIGKNEQYYDDGVPVEEVLDKAEQAGIERTQAEDGIEKLRRQGDLYEPSQDHLRTV